MAEYSKSREDQLEKIDLTGLVQDGMQGVKKLWWLVVLLAVLFAAKNWLTVSRGYQPQYVASATAAVTTAASEDADYINNQTAQQMAQIFPYIMTSGRLPQSVRFRASFSSRRDFTVRRVSTYTAIRATPRAAPFSAPCRAEPRTA